MQQFPFIDLFKSALHVSGDVFAHLQEKFNCVTSRQQVGALYQSCIYSSIAPEDGRKHRPKHVELIKKINKRKLLHLVGYLHRCINGARSHKHQVHEICIKL
jgi:hypothetical protein